MKYLIIILLFSSSITAQKIDFELPNQNADSLSITSFQMSVDTTAMELEVILSDYMLDRVHHFHYRYRTSLYELDTVAFIRTNDSSQYEVRILMCAGREFKLDDPYKGEIRSTMRDKKMLRIGFWQSGTGEEQVHKVVNALSELIPRKERCNPERKMKAYAGHNYMTGRSGDGVFSSGVIVPSLDGSNSVMSRHAAVQKQLDQCDLKPVGEHSFTLSFIVDEEGNVTEPFAGDCPKNIREDLYACLSATKWEPALRDDKKVKSECIVLVGFNVDDKYHHFDVKVQASQEMAPNLCQ